MRRCQPPCVPAMPPGLVAAAPPNGAPLPVTGGHTGGRRPPPHLNINRGVGACAAATATPGGGCGGAQTPAIASRAPNAFTARSSMPRRKPCCFPAMSLM